MTSRLRSKRAALPQHNAERLRRSGWRRILFQREAAPRRLLTAHRSLLTVILLLTAHCSLLTVTAATWSRQRSGTMAWLHAVHFIDQNHGWVAGSNGTLLETMDS